MKTTIAALLMAVCIAPSVGTAYAASEVPPSSAPVITGINPNASGTKVGGVLTIAYENMTAVAAGTCDDFGNMTTDLIAVLRLSKGNVTGTFSGARDSACVGDIAAQEALVREIIQDDVLPAFAPGGTYEVKAVKNILLSAGSNPPSVSMEVELAVRP